MSTTFKDVEIYTDGACKGNPGPGGWGAVLLFPNAQNPQEQMEIFGGELESTNQRMELTAAIKAFECLKGMHHVRLISDSHYLVKGLSEWLPNWKAREWKTSDKKPVANADLWKKLDRFAIAHKIDCYWVKGHAGNPLNERADALANQGLKDINAPKSA